MNPLVGIAHDPRGVAAVCTEHGILHVWDTHLAAVWDAMGHAGTFHH